MKPYYRAITLLMVIFSLTGCKVELYQGLREQEANQMLALLKGRNISSSKSADKNGAVQVDVEESQFAEAIEVLRQNGFPKEHSLSVADVFPSGQLVSSPTQEEAKLAFLKEQDIERMLEALDGSIIVRAGVVLSKPNVGGPVNNSSASIFIKYSPSDNFRNNEADIRRLVMTAVPNLRAEDITVVLQPASYRFVPHDRPSNALPWWLEWLRANFLLVSIVLFGVVALMLMLGSIGYLLRHKFGRKSGDDREGSPSTL
ncbi:type III secretion system inner membrane ring lipoprotein SctJ [Burkholderia sp. Bp8986]|uniref:type III secretion system inner membrane ring lipoprotein SctJ n=1 Tax=Burkholderia sp. Bp8986 TaxID=2184550 RepID=UPI000F5B0409|nr:type III secretion inner membrane ring lipoprotein SctJ [Burkholderia sp. Bp8986]RQS44921.1 EscJ/YscJ/HrcJ family type III secretion inner membrane ring protein [Burkholderia sp. Bp8986]